jgi:two-component system chemotaxis sensor kinase CheA
MTAFVDWFIPPSLRDGARDNLRRARLIVVVCLAMTATCIPNVAILLSGGVKTVGFLVLGELVALSAAPLLLRATGSLRLSAHFVVGTGLLGLVASSLFSGGLESPGLVWWGPYLIFAVMILGTRTGLFWTAVVVVLCIVYLILGKNGIAIRNDVAHLDRGEAVMSSCATAFVALFLLVRVYETLKNKMLAEIDAAKGLIETAHANARIVLDNVAQGLLVADRDGKVGAERSQTVIQWFGPVAPEETLFAYLGKADAALASWLEVSWSGIFDDFLPRELVLNQLPSKLTHQGRHYALAYRPIGKVPSITSVLVVITDVTELLVAERAEEEQREMLAVFQRITSDQGIFTEFIEESRDRIKALSKPGLGKNVELRELHTLKGNTGLFGLVRSARFFHGLEEVLLLEERELNDFDRRHLVDHWQQVEAKVMPILGNVAGIQLSKPEYEDALLAVSNGEPHPLLRARMVGWANEPLHKRFSIFAQQIVELAERLGKKGVTVQISDSGLRLPREQLASFWSSFPHVIRNAVDHGIESVEERRTLGKPENAVIELASRIDNGEVVVEIADDGPGLDWKAVAERARAKGLPTESREDLEAALFADGVTTREKASEVSGRGVGLSAVRSAVLAMGGRICIESALNRGTRFSFHLKMNRN